MKKIYILVILLFVTSIGIFYVSKGTIITPNDKMLNAFAKRILKVCSTDSYRQGCYDREIPKLLAKGYVTMEQAFAITKDIQASDQVYLYCHILGHELGDIETRKDPSKWLDVIARCPPLMCNDGCEHGAVMRRFKGADVLSDTQLASIIPDLSIACEPRGSWHPTELERSMCYHSLGHLAMYVTGADVTKSINLCQQIGIKSDGRNYFQTCVQGVFMIIFQSLDSDDLALVAKIKPTKDKLTEFCSKYSGTAFTACRTEAWPYFFPDFSKPQGLNSFCAFATDSYTRNWCYDTVLRGQFSSLLLQTSGITGVTNYCLSLPTDIKHRCFASIANGWVQDEPHYITDGIALCKSAEKYGYGDECYNGLLFFSKFSFTKGTQMWTDYCNNFPGIYKDKCFSGDVPSSW